MKKKVKIIRKKLNGGYFYNNDAWDVINSRSFQRRYADKIDLIFTSPPFPLIKHKSYGNEKGKTYIKWLSKFAKPLKKVLSKKGSIVIEIGSSWNPGEPTLSLIDYEALKSFKEEGGLYLCQEFVWYNDAKLPGPAEWVTKHRERVKDAYTKIWWLSKHPRPHADNRQILQKYSKGMLKLLLRKKYNFGKRATGHNISSEAFFNKNRGSIPPNVLEDWKNFLQISNTSTNQNYVEYCKKHKIKPHPARMPEQLAEFFIRFLTKEKNLVMDPFAGSNTTGHAASVNNRKWISIEKNKDFIKGSKGRFIKH